MDPSCDILVKLSCRWRVLPTNLWEDVTAEQEALAETLRKDWQSLLKATGKQKERNQPSQATVTGSENSGMMLLILYLCMSLCLSLDAPVCGCKAYEYGPARHGRPEARLHLQGSNLNGVSGFQ